MVRLARDISYLQTTQINTGPAMEPAGQVFHDQPMNNWGEPERAPHDQLNGYFVCWFIHGTYINTP